MNNLRGRVGKEPDGVRLSHVARSHGGSAYWEVKVVLNGKRMLRRFSAEANARAWLSFRRRADSRNWVNSALR
jgi:hypothetical protein